MHYGAHKFVENIHDFPIAIELIGTNLYGFLRFVGRSRVPTGRFDVVYDKVHLLMFRD
jgi:hypothetical protein